MSIGNIPNPLIYDSNSFSFSHLQKIKIIQKTQNLNCNYSISPELPYYLKLIQSNGSIIGYGDENINNSYTITCSNEYGSTKYEIKIIIQ